MLGSRKIASLTYVARAEDGMTPLAADGHVAELSLPPLLADALQRPVAAAVHTAGEQAAFGAVVTLVAHVTSAMDKKIVPSHHIRLPRNQQERHHLFSHAITRPVAEPVLRVTALPANGLGAIDALPPRITVALVRPVAGPVEAPWQWNTVLQRQKVFLWSKTTNHFRKLYFTWQAWP